jgi:septal ring-binding cell division protein DamX
MGFISLLLNNWQLVVIGLLLAALAGSGVYVKVLKGEIETAEAKQQELHAELDVSQASVKNLQQAILDQNAAIEKLNTDAAARQQSHAAEVTQARNTAMTFKKRADDLMKIQPSPGVTKCDAANQLINLEIRNAK